MDRAELAERLTGLQQAASEERWQDVEAGLKALDDAKTKAFAEGIRRMARDLHAEMRALQLDSRLARAAADIPDACARLDAVIDLTEDAATRTLDLVEESRDSVMRLQEIAQRSDSAESAEVGALAAALRKNLMSLSEAQAYQDLSGQIIRRVIALVGNLDKALNELLKLAGIEPMSVQAPDPTELLGPAAGRTDNQPAASQDDADALLADLGL